jgi:hypothetical protein
MKPDTEIYSACMEELLPRFQLVKSIFARKVTTSNHWFDAEIVFLQFRKMLEQIAFASLAANKVVYAAARAKFASEWRATQILKYIGEVNPEFYPQPLKIASVTQESDRKHFYLEPLEDGFLTKEEFVQLYDHCGDVLHARNPYSGAGPVVHVGRSAEKWHSRIENLVSLHRAQLVTGGCWLGAVPDKDGRVHTYTAELLEES